MTVLHPILLFAGLASVSVPILIHLLLRQRRRPVAWGAMRFLIEAYRKQRRRLRIERWLLLAARCLLLALLGLALARPLLSGGGALGGGSGRTVYILLDNGVSSSLREDGPAGAMSAQALDRHRHAAAEVLSSLGPADRAGLILLGGPAEAVVSPASADIGAVRRLVEEATPTDSAADIAGGLEALAAAVRASDAERSRPVTAVVLSDFLTGSADTSRPLPASLAEFPNVRIAASPPRAPGAAAGNVQIVGVEPLRPVVLTGSGGESGAAQREQVRVSLRRTGAAVSEASVTTVRLRVLSGEGGAPGAPSQASVRWQPGQSEAGVSMQVDPASAGETAGASSVLLAEIDRDALAADNTYRRPVGVREALRVGLVARPRFGGPSSPDRLLPAQWLRLALRPTPASPLDIVDIEPAAIDAATLASLDVALVVEPDLVRDEDWPRLRRFVEGGGLLVVTPAPEASVHLWTDAMVRELGLAWRLAREPSEHREGIGIDESSVAAGDGSGVLSLIAPEMAGLARPVRIWRTLGVEEVGRQTEVLLRTTDGAPWAIASGTGEQAADGAPRPGAERGVVLYLASAPMLTWTDLPAKPLMVPLVQEIVRQGYGRAAGNWAVNAGRPAPVPARTAMLRPLEARDGEEVAATPAGLTASPLRRAGVWRAVDEAGRTRGVIAANADADGARTGVQDPGAVRSWLAGAASGGGAGDGAAGASERVAWLEAGGESDALRAARAESPFSLPLLLCVLVIAAAELVMARYFSHAFAAPAGEGGAAP